MKRLYSTSMEATMNNFNDWECSKEADKFLKQQMEPLLARIDNGKKFLDSEPKDVEKHRAKLNVLMEQYEDFKIFHDAVMQLASQHERLTSIIFEGYSNWRRNISRDGEQPSEMMSIQAEMLDKFFVELYKMIESYTASETVDKPKNY